ncbi:MAG: polysulfide reductase NrfD [Planctomycetes bacterium]|nr:polysulfide reductase NrfD [Planctomycetota bacterium]
MQVQDYAELSTTRANPHIDPALHIWGWEVPVYLFLGGLVAGLLVLNAYTVLTRRERELPAAARVFPVLGVPLLAVGLGALFLDLEYKLHVFRFYTTFQLSSPMSWGSWILLVVFATGGLAGLSAYVKSGWPLATFVRGLPFVGALERLADRHARGLAAANALLGVALGIYTGILLSGFAARPLWNTGLLGPLFLVSGLSTGAALGALLTRDSGERHTLLRLDLWLMLGEVVLLGLWLLGLLTGGEAARASSGLVLGGPYAAAFWTLVVAVGLAVPILLEVMALRGRWRQTLVAPALVLVGGLSLRFVLVYAGQHLGY